MHLKNIHNIKTFNLFHIIKEIIIELILLVIQFTL